MLVLRANVVEEGLREGSEALVLRGGEHPLARLAQLEDEFAAISARLEETLDTNLIKVLLEFSHKFDRNK